MSKKLPTIARINKLIQAEEQMKLWIEDLEKMRQEFFNDFGEGIWCVSNDDEENPFLKIEVLDQLKKANEGKLVWDMHVFKPLKLKISPVKNPTKNAPFIDE